MNRNCFLFVLAVALFLPITARALSRAVYPLPVTVAQADAIVVARTTRVPEAPTLQKQTAEIEVVKVLKGDLPKGPLTVRLDVHHWHVLGALKADRQYIFFLGAPTLPGEIRDIMLDGTCLHTEEAAKQFEELIGLTPAWSAPADGLSTTIVPEKYRVRASEELNLFIGCRNVSGQKITLKYSDWPLETHTFWELSIVPQGGAPIIAEKHPTLTPESINEYFSKFPHPYEVTLEPNQEFFYQVQRVNSAKQGWGYKQELDFKFYPMTAAGAYDIAARCKNLRPGGEIVAKGLRVWID
jgi:hypothetical protein